MREEGQGQATTSYNIKVTTSKHYKTGSTDGSVSIQLIGEDGSKTSSHELDNFWRDDFEEGRTDEFHITDVDVGRILVIKLALQSRRDDWACDKVDIKYGDYIDEFPVYDWIMQEIDVIRGNAILPTSNLYDNVKDLIENERIENKKKFPWNEKPKPGQEAWMLPRFTPAKDVHHVPHQLRMDDARMQHLNDMRSVARYNVIIANLRAMIFPIKKLEDYKDLMKHFRMPSELKPFIARWQEDDEQGRQVLNGGNPYAIEVCKALPKYCNITDAHVKGLLNDDKTLEDEMKNGRIFIADYTEWTRGIPRNQRYKSDKYMYCADCLALYYAPGDGRFLPIAIQLKPDDEEYVFSPNCSENDWLLAKMFFRCSDTNAHQWVNHFLWTHGIVETAATAMFRCLSRTHPMYKLCRAHLQHVVVIDQFARDILIFSNSPSNYTRSINGATLAKQRFNVFNFKDLNFPEFLKKKGLDSDKLQNFHFREDAMRLWVTIKRYATKIIQIYYKNDQDVENDDQIQDWVRDLAFEGLGSMDGNTRGCPTSLSSIEELITFITSCVFTSSVLHAAFHAPMFDLYKFVPNAPGGMRLPVHKRGEATMERILETLPDEMMATILLGSTFVLTELPEEEIYLGEFPMELFTEDKPREVLEEFRSDLKEISKKIKERNNALDIPYEYLLPETIPTGTTA